MIIDESQKGILPLLQLNAMGNKQKNNEEAQS